MFDYRKSAEFLKKCQVEDESDIRGTVCPWVLNEGDEPREDLHDTLQAVYVWSRDENFDNCRENAEFALDYVKRRFEWFKSNSEPIKSYDAIFQVLALNQYLKKAEDDELSRIESYSRRYLVDYFKGNPKHDAREYSNTYWKAAILSIGLRYRGEDTRFLGHWVDSDTTLVKPENEPVHKGRGYMHPHDFCSTFGTRLYAINMLATDYDYSLLNDYLPDGFVKRSIDETSFNSFVLYGLCSIDESRNEVDFDKVQRVKDDIFRILEDRFVEGGTKRGDYVSLRESWSTFFVYYAELLRDGKQIL